MKNTDLHDSHTCRSSQRDTAVGEEGRGSIGFEALMLGRGTTGSSVHLIGHSSTPQPEGALTLVH